MKTRLKLCFLFLVFFSFLFIITSCDNENEPISKNTDNEISEINVFNENYDKKVSFTLKPESISYDYQYVYDCRVQIKPKKNVTAKNCILKISIFDGEADPFSEEIITRYYKLNNDSNIDDKMVDIYTNEPLLANSVDFFIATTIDSDYTKNFLNTKTVYFETYGGFIEGGMKYYDSKTFSIANKNFPFQPTKNGYQFEGWYSDEYYVKEISSFDDLEDGMTLYAKWETYDLFIFYHTENDVVNPNTADSFNIESSDILLLDPEREGYSFKGWYDNKYFNGIPISKIPRGSYKTLNLYPKWENNKYGIELDFDDGITENEVVEETYGLEYNNLPIPSREGYVFEGWYLDKSDYDTCVYTMKNGVGNPTTVTIPSNHKLYAKWVNGSSGLIYEKTSHGVVITGCSNENATSIIIPEKISGVDVVSIGTRAFNGMNKVKFIVIPNSLTSIANNVFDGCINEVYYCGTSDEWSNISIGNNNININNASIFYYSESDPLSYGQYWHYVEDVPSLWGLVKYKVEHYLQGTDETYSLFETDELYGFVNATTSGEVKNYEGFISPEITQSIIDGNELIAIKLYYDREKYDLVLTNNNDKAGTTSGTGNYLLGKEITITATVNPGYTFVGWYDSDGEVSKRIAYTFNMLRKKLSYEARFVANNDTKYKVERYLQNIEDDNYPTEPDEVDVLTGTTDTLTNVNVKSYSGFTSPEITQVTIKGDETTIVRLFYTRNSYDVSLTKNDDNAGILTGLGNYKFGKEITVTASVNKGHSFIGWYNGDGEVSKDPSYTFKIPSSNVELEAVFEANKYNINYYVGMKKIKTSTAIYGSKYTFEFVSYLPEKYEVLEWKCAEKNNIVFGEEFIWNYTTDLSFFATIADASTDFTYEIGGISGYSGEYALITGYNLGETNVIIPDYIKYEDNYYQVGLFFRSTFENSNIESIVIPSGIVGMGDYLFNGCQNLETVTFKDNSQINKIGVSAFKDCKSITNIVIPSSVKSIGFNAFSGCSNLESITIPSSITSVGMMAFNCINLKNVYYDGTVEDWCKIEFDSTTNDRANPKELADNIYFLNDDGEICNGEKKYSTITKLSIPDTIVSIGNSQFCNFNSIVSVEISSSVKYIGDNAFACCVNLERIVLTDSVLSIGDRAFIGCSSLESIVLPDKITSIGSSAFAECSNLNAITLPNGVTEIGDGAFSECHNLESIVLPECLTKIEEYMFSDCENLKNIIIPNDVTEISEGAFCRCSNLTTIEIPNSVISIGRYAFFGCAGIRKVFFNGSLDEWNQLIANSNGNTPINNSTELYVLASNEYILVT